MNDALRIKLARECAENGEYGKALELSDEPLAENPNHVGWLCLAVFCLEKMEKLAVAYQLCKRLLEVAPKDPSVWLNMVNLESRLWMTTAAIKSAKRGLQIAKDDTDKLKLYINMGCIYVDTGRFEEALKYLKLAAQIDPDADKVHSNLGFCELAMRHWEAGWKHYRKAIGQGWRTRVSYKGEPEWDGTKGQKLVLYGEQGIGDQICFASVIPDVMKDCEIILDTHPKLKNLFARSFPDITVYGTHMQREKPWAIEDREFDASFPMGQLGEYYRLTDQSFPCEPFLKADQERSLMWKALWKTKKKPVIGIAWTGGIQRTGRRFRVSTLEDWMPLFKSIDAHWVSLEYKPTKEIDEFKAEHPEIDIKEYPHATLTDDYDDTASLVDSLDLVITVPTSIGHLAGALGKPVIWMKHAYPCWKLKAGCPFHPITHIIDWKGEWKQTIKATVAPARSVLCLSDTTPDSRSPSTSCDIASSPMPQSLSA